VLRRRALALACWWIVGCIVGCGVRAPSPVDVTALVQRRGPVEARRDLEIRVAEDPRDVGGRLALAALNEQVGRPSAAIEQLEAVVALGGPIGTRWHASDRERFGRLLVARARARIDRGAPAAVADLSRAKELGARVESGDVARAKRAVAIVRLRHADTKERAAGKQLLRELAALPDAEPSWRGADAKASAVQRGELGAWLWSRGARRAAWDELAAWHDATKSPRDERLHTAYLVARAWWTPFDGPAPGTEDLVGPARCAFRAASCDPAELVAAPDAIALAALVDALTPRTADPETAAAWLAITLRQALRGDAAWGPAFVARVDVAAIPTDRMPEATRSAFARLAGRVDRDVDVSVPSRDLPADTRLVIAAGRALRGTTAAAVRGALGELADTGDGRALVRVVEAVTDPVEHAHATAAVAYARARAPYGPDAAVLRTIVDGYLRDPLIGDRLGRDAVAAATDAAAAHAALGALFDALADPARARVAWQAAADASPEPASLAGLADALARANDPDATLIAATAAAAASGDPAVVWLAVARSLEGTGEHVHALEAARTAMELAGPAVHAHAIETAIAASRALGRASQVDELLARRAQVAPPPPTARDVAVHRADVAGHRADVAVYRANDDPTDAASALVAHRARPSVATIARLWTASRWNPRDVATRAALRAVLAADDTRRIVIDRELVALAADPDAERGRAAVVALRAGPL
jgi:hypothetical protein